MTPSSPGLKFFFLCALGGAILFYLVHLIVRIAPFWIPLSLWGLIFLISGLFLIVFLARWKPETVKSALEFDPSALTLIAIAIGFGGTFGLIAVWIR